MAFVYRKLFWEIDGVFHQDNLTRALSRTTVIKSEIFKVNFDLEETEWYLRIKKNEKDCLSIFLHNNLNSNVDATFEFGIVSKTEDYRLSKSVKSGADWLKNKAYGFTDFVSLDSLFNPVNGYVNDGKFTIFCELILKKASSTEPSNNEQEEEVLSGMFFNDKFKDCKLQTSGGDIFNCHKAVLAERSPVFHRMFTNVDTEEAQTNLVKIEDVDSKTMAQLLRFIYCLEIENLNGVAHELLIAADKYLMDELKEICIESLIENLCKENVLKSLIIADRITKTEKLFEVCLIVIINNIKYLSKTPEWKALSQPLLLKIVETLMQQSKVASRMKRHQFL